jgi:hypothetical protein
MGKIAFAVAAALLIPFAAHAADKPVDGTKPKPERKICKESMVTGSRFSKTICMTKSDWEQLARESSRQNDDFQKDAGTKVEESGFSPR